MTVFNKNKVNVKKEPMFFGSPLGIQRYDEYKYSVFEKLTEQQLDYYWRPQEFSLQKDRNDYLTLTPEQKRIFTLNLKYQILLDSVQGRSPGMALLPFCSLPELEECIIMWQSFEVIHSKSYTHIIKNVYSNPSEVFDTILDDKKIIERASSVTKAYDDLITATSGVTLDTLSSLDKEQLKELKRKLYLAIISVNILEGIRFYVSFACTFAFAELKFMEGSAKIVSKIIQDESLHHTITNNIIKFWNKGDDVQILEIITEENENVYKMFSDAVEQEKAWADYLFQNGSMIGLNAKLLKLFVEWIANRRMKAIGLKTIYDVKENPLPWMETNWMSSKGVQVAPMETEISSYLIGALNQDINEKTFEGFTL